jgi:DNA-binding LacI/PurR family transcriptional regulator
MRGVSTEVDQRGYYLVVCYAHEHNYLDIYRQKRVDGFILLSPGSFHRNIIETLNDEQVPFVSTAKISDEEHMTFVDVDNFYGATLAVEHLVALGHHKIAFIGKPTLQSSVDRYNGYRSVMREKGLLVPDEWSMISATSSIECGHDCTARLLEQNNRPTAIFYANDTMAYGAIQAIEEAGLRVPGDISVVGFDDIPLSRYITPPLTTVRQPTYEKGVQAARSLIDSLESGQSPRSVILDLELVVRKSTGPVKA